MLVYIETSNLNGDPVGNSITPASQERGVKLGKVNT